MRRAAQFVTLLLAAGLIACGPAGALYFSDHQAIYRLGPPRS